MNRKHAPTINNINKTKNDNCTRLAT